MIQVRINEAIDISTIDSFSPKLDNIIQRDSLVKAWHGTNTFWCLWFCIYGISADVEPPTKTLGQGNMITGFSKIKDSGLYISSMKTSGFRDYVLLEVKPSELKVSKEMSERNYTQDQVLTTLIMGDCILVKPLPAKRVIQVHSNNKVYSRKEFIELFPNPLAYLEDNYKNNMYNSEDNILKKRFIHELMFKEFKDSYKKGESIDDIIDSIDDMIKFKDYTAIGWSLEGALEILDWAKNKKEKKMKKEIIEIKKEVKVGNVILEKGDRFEVLKESSIDKAIETVCNFLADGYDEGEERGMKEAFFEFIRLAEQEFNYYDETYYLNTFSDIVRKIR